MLSHTVNWPSNLDTPPDRFRYWVGNRRDNWRRLADALWLVSQGFSIGREIQHLLGLKYSVRSIGGSMGRLLPRMVDAGLLRQSMPHITPYRKVRLVALDHMGHVISRYLDWPAREGEWERLIQLHEHNKQGEQLHTLSVLWFTWNARLRGYRAGVSPVLDDAGRFAPDAVLENAGEQTFVEVERGTPNLAKWENMLAHQGFIALCARNPNHRQRLVEQIRLELGGNGMATDIKTLLNETWSGDQIPPLWAQTW